MTIQQWEQRAEVALSTPQDAAVQRLGEWAQSADAAYQVAERLSSSAFVPAQFKGKPVELTAAILSGLEVGLSPMAAMRSFDIIQGQAAPRAVTLRALVQSHGHEMVLMESTANRCKMRGRRAGSSEWQTVTWTIERAQQLGLTGKDNWKKQPAAMLVARATSELARLIASDAILGLSYSSEEVADGGTYEEQVASDTTAPTAASGTRKMSRPRPTPDPPGPDEHAETAPVGASDAGEPLLLNTSSKLAKAMYASINEAGITEKERLPFIASVIGREVTSSKDMTEDEARAVLDHLQSVAERPFADEPVDAELVEDGAQ